MTVAFGPASVTTGEGPVAGFAFETQPSGLLHDHFDFLLSGPKGSDPAEGIYALPLAFAGPTPSIAAAKPVWVVFNLGASEEAHDAAIRHAELFLACGIDLNGDGAVGGADLSLLLAAWGTDDAAADLDQNGVVGGADLTILLGAWGSACE
jgi:hypothetical protein